jgi:hypothetical protein
VDALFRHDPALDTPRPKTRSLGFPTGSPAVLPGSGGAGSAGGNGITGEALVYLALTVDKQDGRRFSGTFSSARSSEKVIAVISRNGTIFLADDEGYTTGTLLTPNRLELCYLHVSSTSRIASCAELTKQQ